MAWPLGLVLAGAVTWEAPLECPDGRWLTQRIDAYLGHALADERDVGIVGWVRRDGAHFEVELVTSYGGTHERQSLRHHDCAALVELAASLVAISIDPLAIGPISDGESISEWSVGVHESPELPEVPAIELEPSVSAPPEPEPAPALPPPIDPLQVELYADPDGDYEPPELPPGTRALLEASGGIALNLFPNPAPDVRAGAGFERTWADARVGVRAEITGGLAFAGRFRTADGSAGGDLLAWDVGLRPCALPRWGIVDLRLCAAFAGGQIRGRGFGVEGALTRSHPWVWLGLDAGVAVALQDYVALVLEIGGNANLARPHFEVSNPDASYVTPIVGGRARLGVEFRFF